MSDIVENPLVMMPGTVQQGLKRVSAFSSGELVPGERLSQFTSDASAAHDHQVHRQGGQRPHGVARQRLRLR